MAERIVTVERKNGSIIYTGSVERELAERDGIRHLTVIIAPYITDGASRGFLITHNRHDKQLAKGKPCPEYSYNLFGGHCNPPDEGDGELIGHEVSEKFLLSNAMRELSEELYRKAQADDIGAEELENRSGGQPIYGAPYPVREDELIPLGYISCEEKYDMEYSYLYALPVSSVNAQSVIAADDYRRADGTKGNIALPSAIMSLDELRETHEKARPDAEVCNAITRLWNEQNKAVYIKLRELIGGA